HFPLRIWDSRASATETYFGVPVGGGGVRMGGGERVGAAERDHDTPCSTADNCETHNRPRRLWSLRSAAWVQPERSLTHRLGEGPAAARRLPLTEVFRQAGRIPGLSDGGHRLDPEPVRDAQGGPGAVVVEPLH